MAGCSALQRSPLLSAVALWVAVAFLIVHGSITDCRDWLRSREKRGLFLIAENDSRHGAM